MNFAISEVTALLTKTEAAQRLRVSPRTIDRYMANGTLTAIRYSPRVTRITVASVEALLSPDPAPVHDAPAGVVGGGLSSLPGDAA